MPISDQTIRVRTSTPKGVLKNELNPFKNATQNGQAADAARGVRLTNQK
jgi:hypothetical protein